MDTLYFPELNTRGKIIRFDVITNDGKGHCVTLVSANSIRKVVRKFLTGAIARLKKDDLSIPGGFGHCQFHIVDADKKPYGMIVGAATPNILMGVIAVHVHFDNVDEMTFYDIDLNKVDRRDF